MSQRNKSFHAYKLRLVEQIIHQKVFESAQRIKVEFNKKNAIFCVHFILDKSHT